MEEGGGLSGRCGEVGVGGVVRGGLHCHHFLTTPSGDTEMNGTSGIMKFTQGLFTSS